MKKSGLHKQIVSLFEGVPIPPIAPKSEAVSLQQTSDGATPANRTADAPIAAPAVRSVSRPKPAQRVEQTDGLWNVAGNLKRPVQKPKAAQQNAAQKRQKMMTMMVGVLSVVFVGVLYVAFGGIGQTKAVSVAAAAATATTPTTAAVNPEQWAFPKPLPSPMRDPLVIPSAQAQLSIDDGSALTVRGIVYSEQRPSAIVNNKIVFVGQTINGANVVNITRGAVEFEKDGKRWTQGVQ